jgi:hypothetical protein
MANPLHITIEQAQEIVRNEAKNKGWVRPELRQSQLPETLEALESLRRIRDSFVHVYVRPQSWGDQVLTNKMQNCHRNRFTKRSLHFGANPKRGRLRLQLHYGYTFNEV